MNRILRFQKTYSGWTTKSIIYLKIQPILKTYGCTEGTWYHETKWSELIDQHDEVSESDSICWLNLNDWLQNKDNNENNFKESYMNLYFIISMPKYMRIARSLKIT
jgi:hypothetical protein